MHSSASRAANGMSSAKRACEAPNRSFISEARSEPRASAASAGSVIMHRGLNACCTIIMVVVGQFGSLARDIKFQRTARLRSRDYEGGTLYVGKEQKKP